MIDESLLFCPYKDKAEDEMNPCIPEKCNNLLCHGAILREEKEDDRTASGRVLF